MPLQQRHTQFACNFFREHRFAGARLAFDQQWARKSEGRIHGEPQIVSCDVAGRAFEAGFFSGV